LGLGGFGILAALPMWIVAAIVLSGIIGLGLGDTLYMYCLKTLGVSRAVPLAATYPLFSLLWAVGLLGQPLQVTAALGAAVIIFGIWLINRQKTPEVTLGAKRNAALLGTAVCLAAAIVWSISVTLMDAAVSNSNVTNLQTNFALVTLRMASTAIFFLAISPLLDRNRGFLKINRKTVLLLCLGGLIANGLGWVLMNYSFLNVAEAQAVPISSISPLFATLAGVFLFHEKASKETVLGASAIVAGVFLIFLA
jgi:drug/metabolite transporter (DMT)-like permease